uniref:NMDA receptor synaptonuclear signaling and neuronal migration factor n=1 Tax=Varanus komodoensis TaxID=61221 RepID=A0A8D2J9K9_VARKO
MRRTSSISYFNLDWPTVSLSAICAFLNFARDFTSQRFANNIQRYHLLAESYVGQEDSPEMHQAAQNKRRLSLISDGKFESSFSEERGEKLAGEGPKPRVYTISGEGPMLSQHQSESMELVVIKGAEAEEEEEEDAEEEECSQGKPLQNAGSSHSIGRHCKSSWAAGRQVSKECPGCTQLAAPAGEASWRRKKLERMYSIDRVSDDVPIRTWFPKENLFTFQTATTAMQRVALGVTRARRDACAHTSLCSCAGAQPMPPSLCPSTGHELQDSCCAPDKGVDLNWEAEKELEAAACRGDDFVPPKIMLISSKVPKAEYVPTIIRRDDPSIIPILYDHEHATFDDILEEIEKKLNIYRKGCKMWKMLIFCQGGPGHLYLLKNKVATFAKVEKEEDMIYFWKRLGHLMSKLNPEPNVIHIMGCYVLGNHNGEKLFQNLRNLMSPCRVTFESPLELSAQGKQMIETYFDFRLYRLWKTRQHSKLLDYDDIL